MGKMRACPSCGQEVSKQAAACPKCGHAFKKGGTSPIIKLGCFVVLLIVAGVFGFTLICGKAVTEVAEQHEKEKTIGASESPAAFETTAAKICKD
ncbi:MAG: zinc-ribbon domain-containing protein, partial [Deltaproteobacteria bacterium]|nr:zinc-ribbon domain-containing protein [Deltaproteobacteria bacterium]